MRKRKKPDGERKRLKEIVYARLRVCYCYILCVLSMLLLRSCKGL